MGLKNLFGGVFKNKKVLLTGHTGFKGSWLCIILNLLGADVIGYALSPYTERDNFVLSGIEKKITNIIGDIRDYNNLDKIFKKYNPEIIFHLAAQPLVIKSYENPRETYDINIGGTVNLLDCCRNNSSVKTVVNITSDKCYDNKEWLWGYRENDEMGGHDPYSSSKGCSELITSAYYKSYFSKDKSKSLSSARAGNVIGGGDWQIDRLIPDCIKSLEKNKIIEIRNPLSLRPWQHVLEPLSGYLLLASKMNKEPEKFNGSWNFGPDIESAINVEKVVNIISNEWGTGEWARKKNENQFHESKLLYLDCTKSKKLLCWKSILNIEESLKLTIEWYKNYQKKDVYELCKKQIMSFLNKWEKSYNKSIRTNN